MCNPIVTEDINAEVTGKDINELLNSLRKCARSEEFRSKGVDFNTPESLTDNDYCNLTGVKRSEFDVIMKSLSSLRITKLRSVRTCLGIFIMKLRTGLSNAILGTLFYLKKRHVAKITSSSLMEHFVPLHLGCGQVTKQEL